MFDTYFSFHLKSRQGWTKPKLIKSRIWNFIRFEMHSNIFFSIKEVSFFVHIYDFDSKRVQLKKCGLSTIFLVLANWIKSKDTILWLEWNLHANSYKPTLHRTPTKFLCLFNLDSSLAEHICKTPSLSNLGHPFLYFTEFYKPSVRLLPFLEPPQKIVVEFLLLLEPKLNIFFKLQPYQTLWIFSFA